MTDCPCFVLTVRVDTIWYTVFCSKSIYFRASLVMLALKSVNDGNDDEVNAENDDAPGEHSVDQRNLLGHASFLVGPSCFLVGGGGGVGWGGGVKSLFLRKCVSSLGYVISKNNH